MSSKNQEREQRQNQDQDPRWWKWEEMQEQARSTILQRLARAEPGSAETTADDDVFCQTVMRLSRRRFVSVCLFKSPEEISVKHTRAKRGHVPSVNSSSDENEDDDNDDDDHDDDDNNDVRIIAQCWEYIHCEGYKQHRSDTTRWTFMVPFCTFPWRAPQMENKRKEDQVMWQHWRRSGWASGKSLRGYEEWRCLWCTSDEQRGILKETGKVLLLIQRHTAPVLKLLTSASLALVESEDRKRVSVSVLVSWFEWGWW